MKGKILVLMAIMLLVGWAWATTPHTITVDGNLSDWNSDELIIDDANDDSLWANDEVKEIYLTWDADNLYIGANYTVSNNAFIVYLDTDYAGGETDFEHDWSGWYRRYVTFENYDIDFFIPLWDTGSPSALQVVDGNNTDVSSNCTISGSGGTWEVAIPWGQLLNGGVPGYVAVAAVIAGGDDYGGADIAPDATGNTIDTNDSNHINIKAMFKVPVDSDGDHNADSGVSPASAGSTPVKDWYLYY